MIVASNMRTPLRVALDAGTDLKSAYKGEEVGVHFEKTKRMIDAEAESSTSDIVHSGLEHTSSRVDLPRFESVSD